MEHGVGDINLIMSRFLLLIFLIFVYGGDGTNAQDKFYFSKNPRDASVAEGRPATLRCEVSSGSGIEYYWALNGEPVPNTTRRHQVGPDLVITRADRARDSGEFACIARNASTGFSLTSLAASLDVQCEYLSISPSLRLSVSLCAQPVPCTALKSGG
ncbi:inactive tyrosine-protein kinase 7-like [Bacillus rossius redtenbacheri]|uniref:inactive tyrosine-protein kinase 7-like n=1 Tax=Bacillus rossius redtenbacheri TaxID=93214 RepID=UPI002FDE9947